MRTTAGLGWPEEPVGSPCCNLQVHPIQAPWLEVPMLEAPLLEVPMELVEMPWP